MNNSHFCRVTGCRFMNSHSTAGHRCGNCGEHGHGMVECSNNRLVENLHAFHGETTPGEFCDFPDCPNPHTHSRNAHHCRRCGRRNHADINCIIQSYNVHRTRFYDDVYLRNFSVSAFVADLQSSHLNSGTVPIQLSMGCMLYVRCRIIDNNTDPELMSLFLHNDSHGQYGPETSDLPILEEFEQGCSRYNINAFSSLNGMYQDQNDDQNDDQNNNQNDDQNNSLSDLDNIINNITDNNVQLPVLNYIDNSIQFINPTIPGVNDNENNNNIVGLDNILNTTMIDHQNTINNNINTNINTFENTNNYNQFNTDEEIESIITCPLCRTPNYVESQVHVIHGCEDRCSICMFRNVEVFLSSCGHACMCRNCYQDLQVNQVDYDSE